MQRSYGAVPEAMRKQCPLVVGPGERSWGKAALDILFEELSLHFASTKRARQLSVHSSFRVWLACALLAAGATPDEIMLLLRWSTDAAHELHARLGERVQASLLDAACDCSLDTDALRRAA